MNQTVYIYNPYEGAKRFDSLRSCADNIKCSVPRLKLAIEKKRLINGAAASYDPISSIRGYVFPKPKSTEPKQKEATDIYAIRLNGKISRFENSLVASEKLGFPARQITTAAFNNESISYIKFSKSHVIKRPAPPEGARFISNEKKVVNLIELPLYITAEVEIKTTEGKVSGTLQKVFSKYLVVSGKEIDSRKIVKVTVKLINFLAARLHSLSITQNLENTYTSELYQYSELIANSYIKPFELEIYCSESISVKRLPEFANWSPQHIGRFNFLKDLVNELFLMQ